MNDYRILVVDDEEDLCEILKFNLEIEGYMVDTANSAEEALKMKLTNYHLLLLDVMMGEISGFKMASMMKKNKDTAHIPIIFITAKDTDNNHEGTARCGCPLMVKAYLQNLLGTVPKCFLKTVLKYLTLANPVFIETSSTEFPSFSSAAARSSLSSRMKSCGDCPVNVFSRP